MTPYNPTIFHALAPIPLIIHRAPRKIKIRFTLLGYLLGLWSGFLLGLL